MRLRYLTMIGLLLGLYLLTSMPSMAAATIEFEKTSFDIGTPLEGEKVKAVFPFKNTGDAELEIKKLRASCGCTDAKATQVKVLPGKSASIEAVFSSSGFRGPIGKTISVATNDPDHPTTTLSIVGEVLPIADLTPPQTTLGNLKPHSTTETEILITPLVKQKFKILSVDGGTKQVTVKAFDKTPRADGKYSVKVQVTAGEAPERIFGQLSIVTDLPGNPSIAHYLYGNVMSGAGNGAQPPPVAVDPSMAPTIEFEKTVFDFGKIATGQKGTAVFAYKNTGKSPLEITKTTAICTCTRVVRASIPPIAPGASEKVEIAFDSSGYEGKVQKRVLVKTNDPAHEKIMLTVQAEIQPIAKLSPDTVSFGTLKPGGKYETTITLTPLTPKPFKIVKTEPGKYARITSFKPLKDGKGSYKLSLVVTAGKVEDRVMEQLKIVTDLPEGQSISLPVYGNIVKEATKDAGSS